jgi:hypothetical protein
MAQQLREIATEFNVLTGKPYQRLLPFSALYSQLNSKQQQ